MDWALLFESAANGALVGLMYSLVAMGIVLIYKSSSVPNLAQGSMTMLGAYVVLAFANNAGAPIWLAIPLAIVTMFVIGIGIERVALRRLAGRPIIMILMLTLGLEIFLRAGSMTIWGGTARPLGARPGGRRSSRRARSCSNSSARAGGGAILPIRRPSSATSARAPGSVRTFKPNASAAGLMS